MYYSNLIAIPEMGTEKVVGFNWLVPAPLVADSSMMQSVLASRPSILVVLVSMPGTV